MGGINLKQSGQLNQLGKPWEGILGAGKIILYDAAGNQIATLPVDTELPAAAALADAIANPTVPTVGAYALARDTNATTYSRVSSEVANANTEGVAGDRGAHVSEIVKYYTESLTDLNVTIDDSPTSATSATVDSSRFRKFTFFMTVVSAGVSTQELQVQVQFSQDGGTTWFDYRNDQFGLLVFDDVECASAVNRCYTGDCIAEDMRVVLTGTNTTASNKFTITNAAVTLKN